MGDDARTKSGNYITDGFNLYQVQWTRPGRATRMGRTQPSIIVENCRTLKDVELTMDYITNRCTLVLPLHASPERAPA